MIKKSISTLVSRFRNFLPGEILQLHSCNGLFCVKFNLNNDHVEFIVYNPTTGHYRLIPHPEVEFPVLNIAFDPLKSHHYKLVCIWARNAARITMYSSETGIWREFENTMELLGEQNELFHFENGVFWNGNLHWFSKWRSVILCFDYDKECLNRFVPSLPVQFDQDEFEFEFLYFGESDGCLYAIGLSLYEEMLLNVFELKRDYSNWLLMFHIDLAPLTVLYPSMLNQYVSPRFQIPYLLPFGKEKKPKIVISLADEVILYDISDMAVDELANLQPEDPLGPHYFANAFMYLWHRSFKFIETLACV